jgi:thiopeptide-type bacteriocin biosynthesis protein
VLHEVVAPLTKALTESGAVDHWFFIRYGDPDWHLRLRFHGSPAALRAEVLPTLREAVAPILEDGRLRRVQLDTYEREVERYGSAAGVELAERIFHVDSEAVVEIVELLERGDEGLDERWRLTVRSIDLLLDDLGFDPGTKLALMQQARKGFAKEFHADEQLIGQLGDRFRKERQSLEALLDPASEETNPLAAGLAVLRRRSERIAPIAAELNAAQATGQLTASLTELALSYAHMSANRLLRSAQRRQEMVIYDFLARLYESQAARSRNKPGD